MKGSWYNSEFNNSTHNACLEDIPLLQFPQRSHGYYGSQRRYILWFLPRGGGSLSRNLDGDTVPSSLLLQRPNLFIINAGGKEKREQ